MNKPISLITLGILIGSAVASPVEPRTEFYSIDPVYIYGTRLSPLFEDYKSDFDATIIENTSIFTSLTQLGGMHLFHPLGLAGNSELIVRGGEPNYTKVRIDGLDVTNGMDSRGGGFAYGMLEGMPVQSLSLNRGSRSAVEGSGALNGVLSIVLGSPTEDNSVTGLIGTSGMRSARALTQLRAGRMRSQVGVHSTREDDRYPGHAFEGRGGVVGTQIQTGSQGVLSASVWTTDMEQLRLPEDSGGLEYALSRELESLETTTLGISLRYHQPVGDELKWSLMVGRFAMDSLSDSPGVAGGPRNPMGIPANRFDDAFRRLQAETDLRWSASEQVEIVVGTAFEKQSAISDSVVDLFPGFSLPSSYDVDRTIHSLFAELGLKWSEHQGLQLSQRMEDVTSLRREWSSGLRFVQRFEKWNAVGYVSYQEAFKAPSLFALNNTLVGNAELEPEQSDTWEMGLSGTFREGVAGWRSAVFRQDFENMVDLSEARQRLENLSSLRIDGAELALWVQLLKDLRWSMNLTLLDVDLDASGEILRHRPNARLVSELHWSPHAAQEGTIGLQWTGKRWDSSIPSGNVQLAEDWELTIAWMWQIRPSLRATLELHNVLNRRQELLIGYRKPTTQALLALRWQWGS